MTFPVARLGVLSGYAAPEAPTVTGGTITVDGSYTVHTFTESGDLVVAGAAFDVEYLVVAGGGGGGATAGWGFLSGGLARPIFIGPGLEDNAQSETITFDDTSSISTTYSTTDTNSAASWTAADATCTVTSQSTTVSDGTTCTVSAGTDLVSGTW